MQHLTQQKVFRFAPSPNGHLHVGHVRSALLNQKLARECGGRLLLRIEDIDFTRCTLELAQDCIEDLEWIGFDFETPVRFQSEHMNDYHAALQKLETMGILYRCSCSRTELKSHDGLHDPEGLVLYPGTCRVHGARHDQPFALRLDMTKALNIVGRFSWIEKGTRVDAHPSRWGDVILGRKDIGVSYHIAVVVDDALQGVTDVVRGRDLYEATSIHRLLQMLLGLPEPNYHHHDLVTTDDGEKLSKSKQHPSIRALRNRGLSRAGVQQLVSSKICQVGLY